MARAVRAGRGPLRASAVGSARGSKTALSAVPCSVPPAATAATRPPSSRRRSRSGCSSRSCRSWRSSVSVADILLPDKGRDAVARWLASVAPGRALDPSVEHALTSSRVPPTIAGLVSLVVPALGCKRDDGIDPDRLPRHLGERSTAKVCSEQTARLRARGRCRAGRGRIVRRHLAHTGACGDRPRSEPEGRRRRPEGKL